MAWEFDLLNFLQTIHTDGLDTFFCFASRIVDKGILWIAIALIMMCTKKYRRAGFTMAFALALGLIVGNGIVKPLVARVRPYDVMPGIDTLVPRETDFSFPSGHTLASTEGALSIYAYHKKEGIIAICVALIVSFSRIYLYLHYPTDILGGILLGALATFCSYKGVGAIYERREKKAR